MRLAPTRAVIAAALEGEPDTALLERNLRLSARSQRGDRFLIAGRVTGSVAGLLLAGGITMLVVHRVTVRDDRRLLVGGAVLTAVGGAANIVGSGLSFHGVREIEAARRGELRGEAPARERRRR